jgi:two-component system sensor histidine kinase HydH
VFSPFFTTKADGCGLGLAISERILEQHGGELGFTSSPDEGTTFVVSLPGPQEPHDEPHPDR